MAGDNDTEGGGEDGKRNPTIIVFNKSKKIESQYESLARIPSEYLEEIMEEYRYIYILYNEKHIYRFYLSNKEHNMGDVMNLLSKPYPKNAREFKTLDDAIQKIID